MGTVTERLQLLITASAKGVANEIKGVESASGGAAQKTSLLQQGLGKLGLEGASTGTIMKTALAGGIAFGGAALAKFAADGVGQVLDLTDQVRDFQRASGESAENSSRWVAALDDMEISANKGSTAFFKLSREIGQDGGEALAKFNVEVAKNKDGTTDLTGTVLNISDAYKGMSDQGERAALVQAAFGKAGKELIPILEQGSKGIKEFFKGAEEGHQIFSQEDLKTAREFELALDDLQDNLRGFQIQAGKAIIPTLINFSEAGSTALEATDKLTSGIGGLSGAANIVADNINVLGAAEQGVSAVGDLFSGHFADAGKNALGAIPGVRGFANAIFGENEETNKLADAQKRQKDAVTNLASAQAEHGKNSREAKDAEKELAAATGDLEGFQKDLAGSLQNVNEKLATHTQKLYEDQQASLVAAGDKIALGNAVANVGETFDDLNTTLVANMVAGDNSKAASDRVSQGQRDLATQVLNVTGAYVKQAVDALGPGATAQDKMKAATDAQTGALQYLYAQFPGLREQVQGYVGDLGKIPPTVNTDVTLGNIGNVLTQAQLLENYLNALNGRSVTVEVVATKVGDAWGAIGGSLFG